MVKELKIDKAKFWTDGTGVLYCQSINRDPERKLDVEKAKLYVEAITALCIGKAMPFLIDLRGARGTFSISAAKLLANDSRLVDVRISEAFVTDSISMKLLIMTYKRLYDPLTPFGMFDDFESAIEFCRIEKNKFDGS